MSQNDQNPANDSRMTLADQLSAGFLIDIILGVPFLAASALVGEISGWFILVMAVIAAVWVWARVIRRIRATDR